MKRILITGAGSYIGMSCEKYMQQWPEDYQVDTLDMIGDSWREKDFSGYDAVYHVAGIAHIRETEENAPLYYKVNRDLAVRTAQKAKAAGVRQFVFLSTMSVYGMTEGAISMATEPNPRNHYGRAKWEAEQAMESLRSDTFALAVLRPPMVYGEGCKGNYQSLVKLARLMPVFPDYENKRSMLHVDGLSAFVKDLIDTCGDGLFLPQDEEYVCTCRMVRSIAERMGKKLPLWKVLNPLVALAKACTGMGRKAFGDLYYEREQ